MKTLLLLLLLVSPICAQDFDYGKPEELKGLTKVFIDTGGDTKNRDRIIKSLQDAKLSLEILDSADDAEVYLIFNAGSEQKIFGSINPTTGAGILGQRKLRNGQGMVFIPRNGRKRVVLSFEDTQESGWERKPVVNFARDFIKAYKRANGIK